MLARIDALNPNSSCRNIRICARLLFVTVAVRKGTRIQDWAPILDSILHLLELCKSLEDDTITQCYKAAAICILQSPLQLIVPRIRRAMDIIASDDLRRMFLPFCNYTCDLGRERFQELLMPYFTNFINSQWQVQELELCSVIPKIVGTSPRSKPICPVLWEEHILKQFERAADLEESVVQCNTYLELLDYLSFDPQTMRSILDQLAVVVKQDLQIQPNASPRHMFTLGSGLRLLAQHSQSAIFRDSNSWSLICKQADIYGSFPPFLEAVLILTEAMDISLENIRPMMDILMANLCSATHVLRLLSLKILKVLYAKEKGEDLNVFVTALAIEESPLDMQSARNISAMTRRLASQYRITSSNKWVQQAIPYYCFGMLSFRLSQAWEDAILALKQICETTAGEEVVPAIIFMWLERSSPDVRGNSECSPKQFQQGPPTAFQCSNLSHIEARVDRDIEEILEAAEYLQRNFNAIHTLPKRAKIDAPALALKVLLAVPHVGEKRSRQLVPMFLSWTSNSTVYEEPDISEADTDDMLKENEVVAPYRWKRNDQKAMLNVFASFQNPRVLYRASDVHTALQKLLSNGDVEIQRSALNALFTWKDQGIKPYQQNLMNLLDEARFRDEISTFLQVDNENSTVEENHRPMLMPVVLRLLYGKMIAGTGSGSRSQTVKRKTVLQTLPRLDDKYLQDFIHIALGSLSDVEPFTSDGKLSEEFSTKDTVDVRKQLGIVNMMKDLLDTLGARLAPFFTLLANSLLHCSIRAARCIAAFEKCTDAVPGDTRDLSMRKAVRQGGLQCFILLFQSNAEVSLHEYVPTIFSEILSPRVERLPIETAQSISGVLKLLSSFLLSRTTAIFLSAYDTQTMYSIVKCLEVPSAKDEVKIFVLENILKRIIQLSRPSSAEGPDAEDPVDHMTVNRKVLQPNIDSILKEAANLLRQSPSKELLGATIQTISALAPLVEASSHAVDLLKICAFLLDQPSHRVSPRTKGELLQIIQHFLPLVDSTLSIDLRERIYSTTSSLFGYFKDRENRKTLSQVMTVLAQNDPELEEVVSLCISLNAFSASKMDEPDFDERLKAFNVVNEVRFKDFSPKQWRPIIFNMLFYVRDSEELAIRTNASYALRRFLETNISDTVNADADIRHMIKSILLPALRTGMSNSSEVVRTEYLAVLTSLIRHNPHWEEVSDMTILLVIGEDEASFFGNILHIQVHRRLRALRRLASEAKKGGLRSANVAHIFIPLIEHFIFDRAEGENAHNLSAEAVLTIGTLASSLEWPQYRAMLRRLTSYVQSRPDMHKTVIKLLGVTIDALSDSAEERRENPDQASSDMEFADESASSGWKTTLRITMPRQERLVDDLTNQLLPSLEKYLHEKDESTVSLRVPMAVSVVKLLKLLPAHKLRDRLPPLLTDICNILRSRAQESRDLVRKTLVEISILIGPSYFGFVLKELRSSLARGYQLHVLSYTVHSILLATSSVFKPGDLDYCLPQIVSLIMEDVFGATGREKDADEYISKMKEVKVNKSYDALELVSKLATVDHFVQIIKPLQDLLEGRLDLRMVKKIDELLRRINVGLVRNEAIQDQRVLVFCYEILQTGYRKGQKEAEAMLNCNDNRTKRVANGVKGADTVGKPKSASLYDFKLDRFAFDLLRAVLHKVDTLQTPSNLAAFIPVISDAIVQSNEEVQVSALRLLTNIIKVPLQTIDANAAIYVAQCVKIIKNSISTNAEVAQAALKLVSAILRERDSVQVQGSNESHQEIEIQRNDLAYILRRIIPDLEVQNSNGVVFSFLKAIMTRKVEAPEVYEVLDTVRIILKTNHTKGVRDMARGAYIQFFLDYPQSKKRFGQQIGFLVIGLEYAHAEGRQSILETILLLIDKIGDELVQEVLATFYFPLVMRIVNDESGQCREMASVLLKRIFQRADSDLVQSFLSVLRGWLGQSDELLIRVALQVYCLYFDVKGEEGTQEVPLLFTYIARILKSNLKIPQDADWELLYFALHTFAKLSELFPAITFDSSNNFVWPSVRQSLNFRHAWVKLASAKLLGSYFADFARIVAPTDFHDKETKLPLKGSGGLILDEAEIIEVTRSSLILLRVPGIGQDLASQSVRNLIFLGKIMAQTSILWPPKSDQQFSTGMDEDPVSEVEIDLEDSKFASTTQKPALGHIIYQTARILRRGPISEKGTFTLRSPTLIPLQASLQLLGALSNAVSYEVLKPHVPVLLIPLHNLTDTAIAPPSSTDSGFTEGYKTLVGNAQELMALWQKKMGTTEYIGVLSKVRQEVKARREGRKIKRRIEAVAEPERAGKAKKRKGEKKREKRKEKSGEQRGLRRGW